MKVLGVLNVWVPITSKNESKFWVRMETVETADGWRVWKQREGDTVFWRASRIRASDESTIRSDQIRMKSDCAKREGHVKFQHLS